MMKIKSLREYLKEKWNLTLEEYEQLEDEELIDEILDGYDHIKSRSEKKED